MFFCLTPVYGMPLMIGLGEDIHTARWGVLVAALLLFLIPSLLLGMVSPILVKLVFTGADKVGSTTGTLYAIGSVGNVLGILVSDYVLLAYFKINSTILVMGGVLCVLGILHLVSKIHATGHITEKTVPDSEVGATA